MHDASANGRAFILRPNIVLNWRQTMAVYMGVVVVCLAIALLFAAEGFWPVLAFAIIDVFVLGAALYLSAQRSLWRVVVRVSGEKVQIEVGRRRREHHWVFDRFWTEVRLDPPEYRWYPSRLAVCSRGKRVDIGGFLTEEERVELARELRRWVGPMGSQGERV